MAEHVRKPKVQMEKDEVGKPNDEEDDKMEVEEDEVTAMKKMKVQ